MAPSHRSVVDAVLVVASFWTALGNDDREALSQLLSSTWDDRPDDFAGLYLADRKLSSEVCRFMAIFSSVDVLADDRLRFWCTLSDRIEHVEAGKPMTMWRLELVFEAAAWRVDRSSEAEEISTIAMELSIGSMMPPEPGPPLN